MYPPHLDRAGGFTGRKSNESESNKVGISISSGEEKRYAEREKISGTFIGCGTACFARDKPRRFSYNFDGLTGSPNPGTPLVGGSTFAGTVGQDNWVNTMGTTAQVRSDPPAPFSGNYLAPTVAIPANGFDDILTRVGDNLGLGSQYATFQFDGLVGPGYVNTAGTTVARRSEIMPGVDANGDGDIRGTATTSENGEVAFQFGYESSGAGWFVRRAAYSGTGSVTAATTANGVYQMQLVVNFMANPVTISGGSYFDGAGTLYVKQLTDASGNPVNDVFRLADPTVANVNLGLTTGMGTLGGANPANWNGLTARVADNGGIDNILFKDGLPAGPPVWATDAGNWLSSGNWYLSVPNGVDAEADFTGGARQDSTVFADTAVTVGTMKFNNHPQLCLFRCGIADIANFQWLSPGGCRTGEHSEDQSSAVHREQHDVQCDQRRHAEDLRSDDRQRGQNRHADRRRIGCV